MNAGLVASTGSVRGLQGDDPDRVKRRGSCTTQRVPSPLNGRQMDTYYVERTSVPFWSYRLGESEEGGYLSSSDGSDPAGWRSRAESYQKPTPMSG